MLFFSFNSSPSQTNLKNLIKNLELNLKHNANKSQFLIIVLGDYNAKMQGWYQNDAKTLKGCKIHVSNLDVNKQVSVFNETIINIFEPLFRTTQSSLVMTKSSLDK